MKKISLLCFIIFFWGGITLTANELDFKLEDAVKEINLLPSWISMNDKSKLAEESKSLITTLVKYAHITPENARQLINKLQKQSGEKVDVDLASKIYVFNRIYCRVPTNTKQEEMSFFGGWLGIPSKEGSINILFPLSENLDGQLKLSEIYRGYNGRPYQGLEEFEYFLKRFGPRFIDFTPERSQK